MRKRVRTPFKFTKPSLTQQNQKKQSDVNQIMSKYEKTGILSHTSGNAPQFGDFSDIPNYQETLNTVIRAEEAFAALPAELRKSFDNDPSKFVEFCSNPQDEAELAKHGLKPLKKKQDNKEENEPQENKPLDNNPVEKQET